MKKLFYRFLRKQPLFEKAEPKLPAPRPPVILAAQPTMRARKRPLSRAKSLKLDNLIVALVCSRKRGMVLGDLAHAVRQRGFPDMNADGLSPRLTRLHREGRIRRYEGVKRAPKQVDKDRGSIKSQYIYFSPLEEHARN